MEIKLVNAKKYAKIKGVNRNKITEWKKEGKLKMYFIPKKNNPFFNPEE